MKPKIYFLIPIILFSMASCKKEEVSINNDGFIKTILSDEEMAATACFSTDDNNVITIARSLKNTTPGIIVKLDSKGNEIWRKNISHFNRVLWKAIPIGNSEFITIGYEEDFQNIVNVCKYNFEGELISTHNISVSSVNAINLSPADIIRLNNGNYVFACSSNALGMGYILLTDNAFNLLTTKIISSPGVNYFGCFFYGVKQVNDSIIGFTATTIYQAGVNLVYSNSMLIRTDMNGNMRSLTFVEDSTRSETTNCLVQNNNGLLSITSAMTGWNNDEGCYVNYFNNQNAQFISGRVNLVNYDPDGTLIGRKKILSYPGNGIISSATSTSDGGFILCGTVNQNNSSTIAAKTKIYLLKIDANYNEQWSKVIDAVYPSFGVDAFETNDGNYIITGHQRTNNLKYNMVVIKTDAAANF